MRVTFEKIGRGCDTCAAKPQGCPFCERNINILSLRDKYAKQAIPPAPAIPIKDDSRISEENKRELSRWGVRFPHAQAKSDADASPPDQQEP